MKRVLFIAAIYTLIIHQCTKKATTEITVKSDQQRLQASGKSVGNSKRLPLKKEADQLNTASSFVRNIE
jgi:hypothetical protein